MIRKLTPLIVSQIKGRLLAGEAVAIVSRRYDISTSVVAGIKTGKTWALVEPAALLPGETIVRKLEAKQCRACLVTKARSAFPRDPAGKLHETCCQCRSRRKQLTRKLVDGSVRAKRTKMNIQVASADVRSAQRAWNNARYRCRNQASPQWDSYGGRGIYMDARWDTFDAFLADMGPRPTPKHTLDRIDNDGPYSPENCRWATQAEQNRNRRRARPPIVWVEGVNL